MPLEPLQTDEKLDKPVPKERDMDTVMLFGCGAFVAGAITTYLLSIWPFFAWPEVHRLRVLILGIGAGLVPALIVSAIVTRRFGLPGACGVVGGALTTAIFLYLRLQQAFIAAAAKQDTRPDYPPLLQGLVPLAWVLSVALVAVLLLPKGELPSKEE